MTHLRAAALILLLTALSPSPTFACGIREGTPESWVRDAVAIARVRAVAEHGTRVDPRVMREHYSGARIYNTTIQFEVLELLKGSTGAMVHFEGELFNEDDPNRRPVPYQIGRAPGSCYAYLYKQGAEYLMWLDIRQGALTPYWQSAGATNEQLFGPDDAWLQWVRTQVAARF